MTRTQTKSRLSAGSLGTRLRGSQVGGNLLSQIATMTDRSFADRVVLPVTAAIYRNGEKKQQCLGPWKWESEAKVTRCCLILCFELEKDLES